MSNQNSDLNQILKSACDGSEITFRELFTVLSPEDIQAIKTGEIGLEDLKDIVKELLDSKENIGSYKVITGSTESQDSNQF